MVTECKHENTNYMWVPERNVTICSDCKEVVAAVNITNAS